MSSIRSRSGCVIRAFDSRRNHKLLSKVSSVLCNLKSSINSFFFYWDLVECWTFTQVYFPNTEELHRSFMRCVMVIKKLVFPSWGSGPKSSMSVRFWRFNELQFQMTWWCLNYTKSSRRLELTCSLTASRTLIIINLLSRIMHMRLMVSCMNLLIILAVFLKINLLAPKISKEFCEVRWNEMSSEEVFNLYRSIYSFKNITTTFKGELVKFFEVARSSNLKPDILNSQPSGQAVFCRKSKKLLVKCADENYVEIKQLSIGRKKAMTAISFNNGFLSKCDESERIFQWINKY